MEGVNSSTDSTQPSQGDWAPPAVLVGHSYYVSCLAFSSSSGLLVSGSLDGEVIQWDPISCSPIRKYCNSSKMAFRVVAVSGGVVAAGGDDDRLHVWVDQAHSILTGHENTVFGAAISPDARYLVTGCSGELLKVWHSTGEPPQSWSCVFTMEEVHDLGVTCCTFKPLLQLVSYKVTRSQSDTSKDTYSQSDANKDTYSQSHAYILATGGNDSVIKILNLKAGSGELRVKHRLDAHSGPIMSLTFSASGAYLGSCSADRTVRVWSSSTWRCLAVLDGHSRYVSAGAFGGDEDLFLASAGNQLNLWRLNLDPGRTELSKPFLVLPITEWTGNEVLEWAESLNIEDIGGFLSRITGLCLLQINKDSLEAAGFTGEVSTILLQNIQWLRHGNFITRGSTEESIPGEFLCPITQDIMEHPVQLSDGFIYEELAIKEWLLTRKMTSPMTNLEISDPTLVACTELRARIERFMKET